MRRDLEHENERKNFGIFKEISGIWGPYLEFVQNYSWQRYSTLTINLFLAWNDGGVEQNGLDYNHL